MQFLRLKKDKILKKLQFSVNLNYLKFITVLNEYSEDLSFDNFLKLNPQYTSHTPTNKIIDSYIDYLNETMIVLSSDYYKAIFSYKYTFYKLFYEQDYCNQIYANAIKLEKFISVYKENLISSALVRLTDKTLLPESAVH